MFTSNFESKKASRIREIEASTGLRNIDEAFNNILNEDEVELLVSFLAKKYRFSEVTDNIYEFMIDVVGISPDALNNINANYKDFFDNLDIYEGLTIVLSKILKHSNKKEKKRKNGFPAEFNFNKNQQGIQTYNGKKWYPVLNNTGYMNFDYLLTRVLKNIDMDNCKVMYHGTSWRYAISIMTRVRIFKKFLPD